MSAYLVLVLLLVPAPGAEPLRVEISREWMSASTLAVCQAYADRRAAEAAQRNAETVARLRARVVGTCEAFRSPQ